MRTPESRVDDRCPLPKTVGIAVLALAAAVAIVLDAGADGVAAGATLDFVAKTPGPSCIGLAKSD